MARYGEINNGSWMVNGEQNLDMCVVVCGDDMVEARRKVCAFGRGVKADDGQVRRDVKARHAWSCVAQHSFCHAHFAHARAQERLEGALFRRGRPGKIGQFVMWEFHEWPSETHDEDADRAAKVSWGHASVYEPLLPSPSTRAVSACGYHDPLASEKLRGAAGVLVT